MSRYEISCKKCVNFKKGGTYNYCTKTNIVVSGFPRFKECNYYIKKSKPVVNVDKRKKYNNNARY